MFSSPNKKLNLKLLVNQFINSNRKAYTLLFDFFWEDMYTHAFSLVQCEDIAKDIVQEIWIDVWNRRTSLNDANFEAYLHRAVRNNCFKYFRSNKFNKTQLQVIDTLGIFQKPKIEEKHELSAMEVSIKKVMGKLPKRCKQIFELSRYDRIPNEQIALQLGISKRTVENQLSIALKALREEIYVN